MLLLIGAFLLISAVSMIVINYRRNRDVANVGWLPVLLPLLGFTALVVWLAS